MNGGVFKQMVDVNSGSFAHVICPKCQAESMMAFTPGGVGVLPVYSDLMPNEVVKFMKLRSISYEELLDLHAKLKRSKVCNLMQKSEHTKEKQIKKS